MLHLERDLIDNRHQTLQQVLTEILPKAKSLDIASGFFYVSGFQLIENAIPKKMKKGSMRLLIGQETDKGTARAITEGYRLRSIKNIIEPIKPDI